MALEKLSTLGSVKVDREDTGNGYKWTVSFIQDMGNLRMMLADPYRYEIQRIVTTGGSPTPLYGQFTIRNGIDSVNVNYDADSEALRSALESLPSVGAVEVSKVTGINGQAEWRITFRELIGNVPTLLVDPALLLGSDANVQIYVDVEGSNSTLVGPHPRLAVLEKTRGRPDYTGEYTVSTPGKYELKVSQLVPGGLVGKYYDNQWFYGDPSIEVINKVVNFDWGLGMITDYSSDFVSVTWDGKLQVDKSEIYTIYMYSDDQASVYLDHKLLITASDTCCVELRAEVYLEKDKFYDLSIQYVELTGAASISLSYSSISVKKQIIPSSKLFYPMDIIGSPFPTTIIPGAADYPYTDAFGSGLSDSTSGVPTWFYIQTKDSSGNNQSVDFEDIDPIDLITVKLAGGTSNTIYFPTLEYLGNGLFKASYIPLNSGKYDIDILMGNRHIQCGRGEKNKCSPFALNVVPGPTIPSVSEAESPSFEAMDYLVEAVAGEFGYFYIQAKDAYGNNQIKGGDDFKATFTNKADPSKVFRGNVEDHRDGTYTVRYTIPVQGEYDVAVTLASSEVDLYESLLTCVEARDPFIFNRIYDGKVSYKEPIFCSTTHPTLKVVHNDLHASSSTYTDKPNQALAYAVTGVENSFEIQARDQFGNLRIGAYTSNFYGYGNGESDYFLLEFSQVETGDYVRVSTAVDVILCTNPGASGYFKLSFGGRTTLDIPSGISAEGLEMIL